MSKLPVLKSRTLISFILGRREDTDKRGRNKREGRKKKISS